MTHLNDIIIDIALTKKEFQDFLFFARKYCDFVEQKSNSTELENLKSFQTLLIELYRTGKVIPSVTLTHNLEFDTNLDDTTVKFITQTISDKIPFSYYWNLLNPTDSKNLAETACGDLVDDLADIYRDIKEAILMFDIDKIEAKESALWDFKFHYDNHWSEHCIEALFAIHHYLYENR